MTKYLNLLVSIGLFISVAFNEPWAAVFVYFVFVLDESFKRYINSRNNVNLQRLDSLEKEVKSLIAAQNMRNNLGGR